MPGLAALAANPPQPKLAQNGRNADERRVKPGKDVFKVGEPVRLLLQLGIERDLIVERGNGV